MPQPNLDLHIIDLSTDRASAVKLIRKACLDSGFFYVVNHGIEDSLMQMVFQQSKEFFALPLEEKMELVREDHAGYTPIYGETLDPSSKSGGDIKETFNIAPNGNKNAQHDGVKEWPSEESVPLWRDTMETYYEEAMAVAKELLSLIALALDLDDEFFEKVGALSPAMGFLRLLHYPGELGALKSNKFGASAHSDYGMITLLATNGVAGLQICKEKEKSPQIWEDVRHIDGAFIVNLGDILERWTNCIFRSTLHRVKPVGQERYSVAFFLYPNFDCVVECLESCCSETRPARFPPISGGDYLKQRGRLTYSAK